MKAAYEEYRRVSALPDGPSPDLTSGDPAQSASDSWPHKDRQQRFAFESYVEARMTFFEVEFEHGWPAGSQVNPPQSSDSAVGMHQWSARIWPSSGMIAGLVGVTLFSFALIGIGREQRRINDLGMTGNELRASLDRTTTQIRALCQKLDIAKAQLAAMQARVPGVADVPGRAEMSFATGAPQVPRPQPDKRLRGNDGQSSAGSRSLYASRSPTSKISNQQLRFTLGPLRRTVRIGPFVVTLWAVDVRRKSLNLSIISDLGTLTMPRLTPNQPVWIGVKGQEQPIQFVVDRVGVDRAYGHLVDGKNRKPLPNPTSPTE